MYMWVCVCDIELNDFIWVCRKRRHPVSATLLVKHHFPSATAIFFGLIQMDSNPQS